MKLLIIGGTGMIGNEVVNYFSSENEITISNRTSKNFPVDITNTSSIKNLYHKVGKSDAIICVAGHAKWGGLKDLQEEDFYNGFSSKLMGQINLVRLGQDFLFPNGSITLTTGILADDPVVRTTIAATVNGGIHSFVKAAALELENGIRLNAVSTGVVENTDKKYQSYFPGHSPIPMTKMIKGYIRSVEGKGNGKIIKVYD